FVGCGADQSALGDAGRTCAQAMAAPVGSREMAEEYLRRYTQLPALLYMLSEKKLTLLDPNSWDDKNDSYFLEQYKLKRKLKTVLALCFSMAQETYHHWSVFADGSAGVCIQFKRYGLLNAI